jgi:pimeloyl-ACP methyl ester carboxylesterase
MYPWNVTATGSGPRIVLVHGSVSNGSATWSAQAPLAECFQLVVPDRGGYWPNPPLERIDWELQAREIAELLEPGTHLVGHSYGAVVAMVAAGLRPESLASLTLVEPPAFGLARGVAPVEEQLARLARVMDDGPIDTRAFLVDFLALAGSSFVPPDPLPRPLAQGGEASRVERGAWEAELPAVLEPAPFPCLVVSGAQSAAFDAVCDALERRLPAQRAVLAGAGHTVQRLGAPFNELLAGFVDAAAAG